MYYSAGISISHAASGNLVYRGKRGVNGARNHDNVVLGVLLRY